MMDKQLPFKVILCGESSVGKTTLLRKLSGFLDENPEQTLSCNFCNITTQHNGKEVNLSFWDTAGQEQYRSLVRIFFLGADVVIYVCDLSSKISLHSLEFWIDEVSKNSGDIAPLGIIVANKNDIKENIEITEDDLDNFSKMHKIKWIKVSAISGENLSHLKKEIAEVCLYNNKNLIIDTPTNENNVRKNIKKHKTNASNIPINLNDNNKKNSCC